METIVVRFGDYAVHFAPDLGWKNTVYFNVYPVVDWTGRDTKGTSYMSKEDNNEMLDTFDAVLALSRFKGSVCQRGYWEQRLYFVDDEEYWGEELKMMHDVFFNHILPWCKAKIRELNPERTYPE